MSYSQNFLRKFWLYSFAGLLCDLYALNCAPRRIHVLSGDGFVAADTDIVGLALGQTTDGLRYRRRILDCDCLVAALEVFVCAVLNLEPGDTAELFPACRHGLCFAVFDAGQGGVFILTTENGAETVRSWFTSAMVKVFSMAPVKLPLRQFLCMRCWNRIVSSLIHWLCFFIPFRQM